MTSFTIRPAVSGDADDLVACIEAAYAIYAALELDLPPVSDGVADDITLNRVLVAEAGGAIVGGLVLIVDDGFAHLANVAVRPEFAGQGVGRALIAAAEETCEELDLSELRLTTHIGLPENIGLYRHLGWSETERTGNKVRMSKRLRRGAS